MPRRVHFTLSLRIDLHCCIKLIRKTKQELDRISWRTGTLLTSFWGVQISSAVTFPGECWGLIRRALTAPPPGLPALSNKSTKCNNALLYIYKCLRSNSSNCRYFSDAQTHLWRGEGTTVLLALLLLLESFGASVLNPCNHGAYQCFPRCPPSVFGKPSGPGETSPPPSRTSDCLWRCG